MNKTILSCLQSGYTEPVRDILWGHIYLTPEMTALIKSEPFMRLHRIMQIGPAFFVYPGATHTRASHSIGVYHLARRIMIQLAERGADKWLSREGVFSFLCAALLHDLGHFPFTHSLKELPLKSHEALTAKIIRSEPVKSLVAKAGGDPDFTAAIIDPQSGTEKEKISGELLFYRRLLSGTLDPDKLDYLNRDARYCGVPYGAQDVDFILSCLQPSRERGADINEKGIPSVESVLFSKYLMYRTVYWHRQVRSATAMIKKAVLYAMEDNALAPDELYDLDDQGLFSLVKSPLTKSVRDGKFFVTAAEFPYDESAHKPLLNVNNRINFEKELAKALSAEPGISSAGKIPPEKLIIDIPEPISFESNIYITDEGCNFSESSSTFKKEMVAALVKSLRIVRIFIDPQYLPDKGKQALYGKRILKITQKWLKLIV
ncbi:MAG: HD domain-containing protein [Treponema sp.]|nr:HD domain-containing protein [Treponema sp.]